MLGGTLSCPEGWEVTHKEACMQDSGGGCHCVEKREMGIAKGEWVIPDGWM